MGGAELEVVLQRLSIIIIALKVDVVVFTPICYHVLGLFVVISRVFHISPFHPVRAKSRQIDKQIKMSPLLI